MGIYKEIEGCLITKAKNGDFDVIAHGVNCQNVMAAGIAPQMAEHFGAFNADKLEHYWLKTTSIEYDSIDLLGNISWFYPYADWEYYDVPENLVVVNAYTQHGFGKNHKEGTEIPLDYNALALCFTKINHIFAGKHIGLPQIGCGLGGGKWIVVKQLIKDYLTDCDVTVVIYKKD